MRMMSKVSRVFLLLTFFLSMCSNGGAWDPSMMMGMAAMQNSRELAELPFKDSAVVGLKLGAINCISDATKSVVTRALGSSIDQGHGALRSWYKTFMKKLHGAQGCDVGELFGWKWVLERSINTHISNVAKGARVVRAHVLDQEKNESGQKERPYGVKALKNDILYIVHELQERVQHYDAVSVKLPRSTVSKVLDGVAAVGLGYLGLSWLWAPMNKAEAAGRLQLSLDRCIKLQREKIAEVQSMAQLELAMKQQEKTLGMQFKSSVGAIDTSLWDLQMESEGEKAHYYQGLVDRQAGMTKKDQMLKWGGRSAIALFSLWRVACWFRSEEARVLADSLSDINRTMIVHLMKTLISYLERLAELCDEIKEESDIARLKDDFEFISKNCGETFAHVARILDPEEANKWQRWGKPGQAAGNFGQAGSSGLGGGLPRF
jgi:hypothetical protein